MFKEIEKINENNEDHILITLTLDDGSDLVCSVMAVFEANNKDYIALLPLNDTEDEEVEMMLFRYIEIDDEEIEIENIDTDEEFEIALNEFDKLIKDY